MLNSGWKIHLNQGCSGKPSDIVDGPGTHPSLSDKEDSIADFYFPLEWQQAEQRLPSLWVGDPIKTKIAGRLGNEKFIFFLQSNLDEYALVNFDGSRHLEKKYKR